MCFLFKRSKNLLAIDRIPQRAKVQREFALNSKHKLSAVIMALLTDGLETLSKKLQNTWVIKQAEKMTA